MYNILFISFNRWCAYGWMNWIIRGKGLETEGERERERYKIALFNVKRCWCHGNDKYIMLWDSDREREREIDIGRKSENSCQ